MSSVQGSWQLAGGCPDCPGSRKFPEFSLPDHTFHTRGEEQSTYIQTHTYNICALTKIDIYIMQNVPGGILFNVYNSPDPDVPVLSAHNKTRNTRVRCLVSTSGPRLESPACEPSLDIVNEYLASGNRVKIWSSEIKFQMY